jgi:hypothetical protein
MATYACALVLLYPADTEEKNEYSKTQRGEGTGSCTVTLPA